MNEKILKYLYDVKLAIDEIDTFFIDNEKRYEEYQKNILLIRAIERNWEIIGEAIKRILAVDPNFPFNNAKISLDLEIR